MNIRDLLKRPGDVVEVIRVPTNAAAPKSYTLLDNSTPTHHDRFSKWAVKKLRPRKPRSGSKRK